MKQTFDIVSEIHDLAYEFYAKTNRKATAVVMSPNAYVWLLGIYLDDGRLQPNEFLDTLEIDNARLKIGIDETVSDTEVRVS
jgi:hypothetical protein